MCGIFGFFRYKEGLLDRNRVTPLRELVNNLATEASTRGRNSAGVCIATSKDVTIFKHHVSGADIKKQPKFIKTLNSINSIDRFYSVIGHTRLQTQGTYYNNKNNHPIICGKTIGVHNGIIGNNHELFKEIEDNVKRIAEVDSEIIFALINLYIESGDSVKEATIRATSKLRGSFSCAAINTQNVEEILFFRGSSDMAFIEFSKLNLIVFASTENIIRKAITATVGFNINDGKSIENLDTNSGRIINLNSGKVINFPITKATIGFNY